MKRINLNQFWHFRQRASDEWRAAEVPGCVHTDLMRHQIIPDPFYRDHETQVQWVGYQDWEYSTRFQLTADDLQFDHLELVCEGIDTIATVTLNGVTIAALDNMFRTWRLNIKKELLIGENHLHFHFASPIRHVEPRMKELEEQYPALGDAGEKTSPHVRKAPYQFGWDWGPRLVTCGIWRPIAIEAWNEIRLDAVEILYQEITAEKALFELIAHVEASTLFDGELIVTSAESAFPEKRQSLSLVYGHNRAAVRLAIEHPALWFPNGYGPQNLYTLTVQVACGAHVVDERSLRIGLRTCTINQTADEFGKSFEIVVNDIPMFAKGGNWIPADSFPTRVGDDRYAHLLRSCQDAHMNMVRVWGGGIYEDDRFYDLCDELGILVWQDFMFSCSLYPATDRFLENIRHEATDQIQRLRHHPCIALWCGNNEMEWGWKVFGWSETKPQRMWDEYELMAHHVLPNVCRLYDPQRLYWPSSPSSMGEDEDANSQRCGDVHYWDVWHKGEPFQKYREQFPRFISEYGFQSFPLLDSVAQFAVEEDFDINSTVMRLHQKNPRGNELIHEYMLREYPQPRNFEAFLYSSQILQAEGIRQGAEHFRRLRARCMGSLYWQINDCWPVASWSSIDYTGRWKALHYAAKRFYAPLLLSPVEEQDRVSVYLVSDLMTEQHSTLRLELLTFSGEQIWRREKSVRIPPLSSAVYEELPISLFAAGDRKNMFLYCSLEPPSNDACYYFAPVKELHLPKGVPILSTRQIDEGFEVTLCSQVLLRHVQLGFSASSGHFSDNFFDLVPNKEHRVHIAAPSLSLTDFNAQLKVSSLVDAF